MNQKSILFVDDEKNILRALQRTFFETDYELYFASCAQEALDQLLKVPIDMIISDMRMPDIDGYQLLQHVRDLYPHIARIILSGYSDREKMIRTVSDGIVKAYLYKPWNNSEFVQWVDQCFEIYSSISVEEVVLVINKLNSLPVFSRDYNEFVAACSNDADLDKITHIIEGNISYTANLLRVCNSSIYNLNTASIKQAVTYLGLIATKDLIMATEVIDSIKKLVPRSMIHSFSSMIRHLDLMNIIFHDLYFEIKKEKVPEYYESLCLLHDIGQLIMCSIFTESYEILKKEALIKDNLCELEKDLFGVSHCQVGAYLADWWNLPLIIQEVCLYHHNPFTAAIQNQSEVMIIHLADCIADRVQHCEPLIGLDDELNALGLNEEQLQTLCENADWSNKSADL